MTENTEETTQSHSAAWAFVLEHGRQIDYFTRKFCGGCTLDPADFRSELIARLVEKHHNWDRDRGWKANNWIFANARHVKRSMVRHSVRNMAPEEAPPAESVQPLAKNRGHGDQGLSLN